MKRMKFWCLLTAGILICVTVVLAVSVTFSRYRYQWDKTFALTAKSGTTVTCSWENDCLTVTSSQPAEIQIRLIYQNKPEEITLTAGETAYTSQISQIQSGSKLNSGWVVLFCTEGEEAQWTVDGSVTVAFDQSVAEASVWILCEGKSKLIMAASEIAKTESTEAAESTESTEATEATEDTKETEATETTETTEATDPTDTTESAEEIENADTAQGGAES